MQVGGFDVDDEWVSKLHKHLWELQGIWKGLKEYVEVLAKYGIHIPSWSWVSFTQVMGIVSKITKVVAKWKRKSCFVVGLSGQLGQNRPSRRVPGWLTRLLRTGYSRVCLTLNGLGQHKYCHNQRMLLMLSWVSGKKFGQPTKWMVTFKKFQGYGTTGSAPHHS